MLQDKSKSLIGSLRKFSSAGATANLTTVTKCCSTGSGGMKLAHRTLCGRFGNLAGEAL